MESFDNENEFEFSGNVPGTVQGDLIDLELMPHPYIGTNERLFKRLEEKDWTYTRTFFIENLNQDWRYELVLEGIDTLSSIYVNDKFVGKQKICLLNTDLT